MRSINSRGLRAACGIALAIACSHASAQTPETFPSRQVTFVVSFPAGGTSDILARAVGQKLALAWGQPVVVENRPGASGNIAAATVGKAAPDGYTLLLSAASISVSPSLYKDPGFKAFESVTPVTVLGTVPFMLVTNPSLPIRDIREFIDYAKKNPDKLALGSGGNGTITHMAAELLKIRTGVKFFHVPFKGGPDSIRNVISGTVQFTIDGGPIIVPHIESGKLRLLAVASAQRLTQYPEIPTLAESGIPGFEASAWQMVLVTGGTPQPIVEKIYAEIARALRDPELIDRLKKLGVQPLGMTPDQSDAYLRAEMQKWSEVVRVSGAKID